MHLDNFPPDPLDVFTEAAEMSSIPVYMSLSYEEYKWIEEQMAAFKNHETVHKTTGGFYHKSFRLEVGFDKLILEFHGPLVKAATEEPTEEKWQQAKTTVTWR